MLVSSPAGKFWVLYQKYHRFPFKFRSFNTINNFFSRLRRGYIWGGWPILGIKPLEHRVCKGSIWTVYPTSCRTKQLLKTWVRSHGGAMEGLWRDYEVLWGYKGFESVWGAMSQYERALYGELWISMMAMRSYGGAMSQYEGAWVKHFLCRTKVPNTTWGSFVF